MTVNERAFVSDTESWEVFVGSEPPDDSLFEEKDHAEWVDNFLQKDWPWDEAPPSWLRGSLLNYLDEYFIGAPPDE